MIAVIQRVRKSSVSVDDKLISSINKGFLVLLGVCEGDELKDAEYIANKISGLRIFEDEDKKMNLSIKDIEGEVLIVSQFTLLGDVRKGKRPSFIKAAKPEIAKDLYLKTSNLLKEYEIPVKEGIFQADMLVDIQNDGPVTILLDSNKKF